MKMPSRKTVRNALANHRRKRRLQSSAAIAFSALVAMTSAAVLADRGRGSIRAAARPEPARVEPVRVEPVRPAPEVRREPVRVEPQHVEPVRVEPAHVAPVRRDWDDHDEDGRHFGGFGHGVPIRIIRGQRFHDLPHYHWHVFFNNFNYYFDDDGTCYQQEPDGQYLAVQPPIGVVITGALPTGAVPIVVGPTTYHYLDGIFYTPQNGGFAVVNPPPGIVVPVLPSGATQVVINNTVLYQFNGFNYAPSVQDGVTVYTVTPM
jgi:hypothetical protein